jgi:ornithine cyclodeaminase
VFEDRDLRPGTHINGVGAFTPEMQEVPPETVARATVVVDAVEAAIPLRQGLINQRDISLELGAIAAGSASGRNRDDEITFFKSVGNAVQDVVVARRAVDRAKETGVGATIDLSN